MAEMNALAPTASLATAMSAPGNPGAGEDDVARLLRCRKGDRVAFGELVEAHTRGMRRLALRLLRTDEEADDCVQECWLKVWNGGARRYDPSKGRVTTWLYRIVHNEAIDRLRKAGPLEAGQPTLRGEDAEIALETTPNHSFNGAANWDPDDVHERQRRVTGLRDAVEALPERQRTALTLRHFHGRSQREAAEIMGVSEDALESLVARARRTLKSVLAGAEMQQA